MDPEETVLIKEAIKYKRNYHLGKNMLENQIDHLNGKMFFDHLSKVRKDILLRKVKKKK